MRPVPFSAPGFCADRAALAAACRDADIEELPSGLVLVAPPRSRPVLALDRRYNGRFEGAVYLYTPRGSGRAGFWRAVTLHHGPEDADAARRTARLCARLLRLHRERFGRDAAFPRGSAEARVWLTRNTPPGADAGHPLGGETRDNEVYLFGVGAPRTAIEWVRTVAHEWGHLTLPAARGFQAPENDAAGFLGERLYLKWLREDTRARRLPAAEDGTEAKGLDLYHARQVAPLIARFQAAGPGSRQMEGRDARAMDLYIGAALACDDALGSAMLGRGLFTVLDVRPRAFLDALREATAGTAVVPVRLPAWIPLQRTTYQIAPAAPGQRGAVAFADRPHVTLRSGSQTELRIASPGWNWVRSAGGKIAAITLARRGRT